MSNTDWMQRSLKHVWHPCTQMKDHEAGGALPLVPIASADGVWLTDFDGKRYIDAVSSWWTNLFGHRHPVIVDKLKAQLDTLDHVLLGGFTHQPVVELSERLVRIAPKGLTRCFYADNGSSAVEVALKMSAHYWRNSGKPAKTKFIALANSYHGETLGALAVSGEGMYRDAYQPLLMQPIVVPSPDCFDRTPGEAWEDYTRRRFRLMEETLQQHAHEVAAVIVEPLVQCAGGMRMYHPIYLRLLREACSRYGVHYIADEIAVGFGRTGRMFANDWADGRGLPTPPSPDGRPDVERPGVTPDFLCLSKGLTSGTLPLAVTMTSEPIYEAFYGDHASQRAFLHSHSYTGNPIACAAALATLDIFESDDWTARNRATAAGLWGLMSELASHRNVIDVRQQGMILAVELAKNPRKREPYPASERRGLRVYRHGLEHGVLLRPLGNVVYLMPPYVINDDELVQTCRAAIDGIDAATRD
jgi:adenosylmethionine-8-amino-7-oxononanoate aminotransferase